MREWLGEGLAASQGQPITVH